jgi:hypothetical protein
VDVATAKAKPATVTNLIILSSLLSHRHLGGVVHACSVVRIVISVRGIDDSLTILFHVSLNVD